MNKIISRIWPAVAATVLLVLQSACSVTERVGDAQAELMEHYRKLPDWEQLPVRSLSWERAMALLEKQNLEMQRARQSVKEAQNRRDRVYRQFIPLVDIGYYFNTALMKSKGRNYSDYSNFDVNIIFSLPDLLRLPVDHYTAELALFKAEKDLEQKRRELVAKLWQSFREAGLEHRKRGTEDAATASRLADKKLREQERALQSREKTQQLCALLNDYTARWQPNAATLPRINWQAYREKAKVPDALTQTQMALALEAARLQKLGVAVHYLPSARVNFYSPSLFSVSGGTTEGFLSGETDVRMNLNTYLQLDTRMEVWSEWAMARENYRLVQQELTQKMHEYRNKMQLLLESWKAYDDWKRSTEDYLDFRRRQGVCEADGIKALYDEDIALQKEMQEQEKKNLERECALIQEYGLPNEKSNISGEEKREKAPAEQ